MSSSSRTTVTSRRNRRASSIGSRSRSAASILAISASTRSFRAKPRGMILPTAASTSASSSAASGAGSSAASRPSSDPPSRVNWQPSSAEAIVSISPSTPPPRGPPNTWASNARTSPTVAESSPRSAVGSAAAIKLSAPRVRLGPVPHAPRRQSARGTPPPGRRGALPRVRRRVLSPRPRAGLRSGAGRGRGRLVTRDRCGHDAGGPGFERHDRLAQLDRDMGENA